MRYVYIFAVATAIAFLITPTIRFLALKFSVIDRKNGRKVHTRIVTRFGGLGIYLGFIFAMLMVFLMRFGPENMDLTPFWTIIMASTLILFLGAYDDVKGANAKIKFSIQILASLLLINSGLVIRSITIPFLGSISLGWAGAPLTILWLVGITNAINLIDGVDGLAAGIVIICSLGLFVKFLALGSVLPAFFAVALAGACLGFLRYNFPPAKIFMGDTGSMFLGFSIAALVLLTSQKAATSLVLLVPVLGLGVPILDTSLAFVRRVKRHRDPFLADKEHVHHRLLAKGFTVREVIYILWSVTILLNIIAFGISLGG
ncbi:MAG: MraY family glycosyltransferase [Candidatus Omnitrophota bacterium]